MGYSSFISSDARVSPAICSHNVGLESMKQMPTCPGQRALGYRTAYHELLCTPHIARADVAIQTDRYSRKARTDAALLIECTSGSSFIT